jgi:nicotinate-nucleotide pyrophosphorylase (carboxylating)
MTRTAQAGLDPAAVDRVLSAALAEDLPEGGDPTTDACVPPGLVGTARFTPRRAGVLAGVPAALAVLERVFGGGVEVASCASDGEQLAAGEPALAVRGDVRALLSAERTVLNLLCHLSGIATHAAAWVQAVRGTGCVIRDSRKTLPGLRALEKYAVRCGGARNHRMGLADAVLIKDNHVLAAGGVGEALGRAAAAYPALACEVEVDTLDECEQALAAGADEILLDNFSPADCAAAVRLRGQRRPTTRLEASGGLTLEAAADYATTGVDYLAVGALTHSSPALDIGMDLRLG